MKYFIDTEFIEGFHKPFLGKRRHFIDLISIGIVCEDGREYYAISKDFDPKKASQWVKDNVISKLPQRHASFYDSPRVRSESLQWKHNDVIAHEIKQFLGFKPEWTDYGSDEFTDDTNIEFYAYYADYDWVLFCSLFGTMMQLPHGMPKFCMDLKQMLVDIGNPDYKNHVPQVNEHNALDDARWNQRLYKWLMNHERKS